MSARIRRAVLSALESRRLMAAGDLDLSFGGGKGFVVRDQKFTDSVAFLADGKVVGAGIGPVATGGLSEIVGVAVTRLNADGTLDKTFGGEGVAVVSLGFPTYTNDVKVNGLTIAPDGSALLAVNIRYAITTGDGTGSIARVVRVSADGKAVQTLHDFNSDAFSATQAISSIAVAKDGDIYAGGTFQTADVTRAAGGVVRMNADGTTDTALYGTGKAILSTGYTGQSAPVIATSVDALTVTNAGTIVGLASTGDYGPYLAKTYSPDGHENYETVGRGFEFTITAAGAIATSVKPADTKYMLNNSVGEVINTQTALAGTAAGGKAWRVVAGSIDAFGQKNGGIGITADGAGTGLGFGGASFTAFGDLNGLLYASAQATDPTIAADAELILVDATLPAPIPGDATSFPISYDFGGRDRIVAARTLADGKLAIAGYTVDANGIGRLVLGRVQLAAVVPPMPATATIAGVVFNDANGNGIRDVKAGEGGIAGRLVYVDLNKSGVLDGGDITAVTDAGGYYELKNVPVGTFTVRQAPSTGYATTTALFQSVTTSKAGEKKFIADFGNKLIIAPAPPAPPAAPTGATVTIVTSPKKVVHLAWSAAPANVTGYRIERHFRGESTWTSLATLGAGATNYDDAAFLNNATYEYRIVAINASGEAAGATLTIKT